MRHGDKRERVVLTGHQVYWDYGTSCFDRHMYYNILKPIFGFTEFAKETTNLLKK